MTSTVMTPSVAAGPASLAKHTLAASIFLHLFPGAAMVSVYLAVMPLALRHGLPPLLILSLTAMAVMAPLEIGHLLLIGRRGNGKWSLSPAVAFPPAMRAWRYGLIVLGLVAVTIVIYALVQPADRWFAHNAMGWLPQWFNYAGADQYARYSRGMLLLTVAARFAADVLIVPAAEELYFRGYLLPRIPGPGWVAPILNTALFAIYHFWQPYNWPSIFCFLLPTVLAVRYFKDVRIGIYTHVMLNLIGFVSFAAVVLRH